MSPLAAYAARHFATRHALPQPFFSPFDAARRRAYVAQREEVSKSEA